jgi:DHA1 family bicyclomycin/chloramphenicol resistance-like MFS transporter
MSTRLRLVLIFGALTAFGPLSVDMYLPAFPTLAREFATDPASVQATLSTYFAGIAVGQAVYGPLSDRFGRRAPLIFGLCLYVVASAACALAPTIESFWVARLVQSFGGCAGLVISRAAVRDLYAGAEGARFFSHLMLVLGVAPIVGPLAGGQLMVAFGWRAIFWTLAALALCSLIAVLHALPETLPRGRRATGGFTASLVAYRELLADWRYLAPTLAANFVYAGLFAYIAGTPFVFIELHGISPQSYGLLFGLNAAGIVVAGQLNARFVGRYGPARLLRIGLAIFLAAALILLANAITGVGGLAGIAVPLFVTVSTVGFAPANALALAQEPYPHAAGSATALFGAVQWFIGAIMAVLVGVLHDGSVLPMASLIAVCAIAAFAANGFGLRASRPA